MVDPATAPLVVGAAVSAAAGVVSFASPCVLPLVPGYLAFASGVSSADTGRPAGARRSTVVLATGLFVLGFAVFFTLLGGAFGALGQALAEHRRLVGALGGVVVLLLGLFLVGAARPRLLERDTRMLARVRSRGLLTAFPLGVVFAAGWTPCIGPTLASVLTLTAADGGASPARGAVLAFCYAVGLGLPFLLVAVFLTSATTALSRVRARSLLLQRGAGVVLIVLGVLLVTGVWDRAMLALQPVVSGFTPSL